MLCLCVFAVIALASASTTHKVVLLENELLHLPVSGGNGQLASDDVSTLLSRALNLPLASKAGVVGGSEENQFTLPVGDAFRRVNSMVVVDVPGSSVEHGLAEKMPGAAFEILNKADGEEAIVPQLLPELPTVCVSAPSAMSAVCSPDHAIVPLENADVSLKNDVSTSPMWASLRASGGAVKQRGDAIFVLLSSGEEIVFNLQVPADRILWEELSLFSQLPLIVGDRAPAVLLLSLSGLTSLESAYGDQSAKVQAAMALINSALPELQNMYNAARPDNASLWAVSLHSNIPSHHETHSSTARRLLMVPENGRRLSNGGLVPTTIGSFAAKSSESQLLLWFLVGFIFVVFWASSALFSMDYGKDDSGLFSKFKPEKGMEEKME